MADIINGTDLYVFLNDDLVAYSLSYSIAIEAEGREITNKGTGIFRTYKAGLLDVSAACDGLYVYGSGASQIYDAMILRQPVKLEFGEQDTGMIDTTKDFFTGNFIIVSFEHIAGDAENATYAAKFKHSSDWGRGVTTVDEFYWVSPTGTDGAAVDGSSDTPWRTLSYAATRATVSGDVIHVTAGTFTETAQIVLSPGVSIVGAGITTIITSAAALEPLITASSAAGNAVNGNQSISYIQLDGNLTVRRAIYANFRSNVKIHHCTIIDFLYSGITFDGTVSIWTDTPTNTIPTGNEVHDCIFTNNTQLTGNSMSGHIRPEGQSGLLIYDNTFDQTDRVAGQNADIIVGYQNYGLQIHDNVFTKNDNEAAAFNFFFEIHYTHGGMDIYNNTFNGAATLDISGVIKGTYSYGARIHHNDMIVAAPAPVDANYSPAITLESFDEENDIFIYQNYFKNVRGGVYLNNVYTSADNIWIYYNVFENIGNATNNFGFGVQIASAWGSPAAATPMSDIYILNNVIDCGTEGFDGIGAYVWGTITNLNIRNNIINGNFEDYAIDFKLDGNAIAATINTLNINNNIFFGTGGNSFHHAAAITINTEDSTGNIVDNPDFVGATDFHLQAGSPCINAGLNVSLTLDYDGQAVSNPPEIGAYEY